jgi:hypothetical protein
MVNSGMNAHTMMAVEKNSPRSTSCEARMMRALRGRLAYSPELMWR